MTKDQITLGDIYKDTLTGLEGVAIARTEWLNGCVRISLQPQKLDKDGKIRESQVVDVEQLVLVKAMNKPAHKPAGGPMPTVARARDPR